MIAEFFTEPTGEPTGNRKVERIHSVNSFQCLNRRFKKSVKKLPKTNRSRIVLCESVDSKWVAVADPGEGPGPLPYFWTILRPEGPNKIFFKTAPSPLSQGLNVRAPLHPLSEVWIRLWMVQPKKEPTH